MASWETKGTRTQGGTEGIPFFGGKKKGKQMSFLHVNMVQSPMPSERQNIPKQEPLGTPQNRGRLLHPRQASTEAPPNVAILALLAKARNDEARAEQI